MLMDLSSETVPLPQPRNANRKVPHKAEGAIHRRMHGQKPFLVRFRAYLTSDNFVNQISTSSVSIKLLGNVVILRHLEECRDEAI